MKSSRVKKIWNPSIFFIILGLLVVLNMIVHELGHCFTIDAVGGKCEGVYFMPGVQVWPLTALGQPYPDPWGNDLALTVYEEGASTEQGRGLVSFMGSGSVALLSPLALLALYIFRPRAGSDILCSHNLSWIYFSIRSCRAGLGCAISS